MRATPTGLEGKGIVGSVLVVGCWVDRVLIFLYISNVGLKEAGVLRVSCCGSRCKGNPLELGCLLCRWLPIPI